MSSDRTVSILCAGSTVCAFRMRLHVHLLPTPVGDRAGIFASMIRLLAIFFVGGLSTAILITGHFTPDWFAATGTWVGAFATAAAVIWAVEAFRRESRHREEERVAAEREREHQSALAKLAREASEAVNAAGVKIRCFGESGSMGGPKEPARMTTIIVEIANGSSEVVDIEGIDLPGVVMAGGGVRQFVLPMRAGDVVRKSVQTGPFAAENHEFMGAPLTFSTPVVTYRMDGVLWRRRGDTAAPERLSP